MKLWSISRTARRSQWAMHLAFAALALASLGARADDIDIYTGLQSGAAPNLLIILDNSAAADASSTFTCTTLKVNDPTKNLGFEQCGLYNAVSALGNDPVLKGNINLGLMYFPKGKTDGGQFVLPAQSPTPSSLLLMDDAGVNKMLTSVSQLSLANDKSNNNQIAQAMQESWVFYQGTKQTGQTGLSGTSYPGVNSANGCARNFVLYITLATNNQQPQDSGNKAGYALQAAEGLSSLPPQLAMPAWKSPISLKVSKGGPPYSTDYSDEWANFMFTGTSLKLATPYPSITTYTIILSDGTNPEYEQVMVSMAEQGGGKYFVVKLGDLDALAKAIGQVFDEVQSVNSVFAAPVLPVSANTQGTYLNQIYIGMFRPDANGNPRWMGNLKQYQFGVDTSNPSAPSLYLADASWGPYGANLSANPTLSAAGTGFIAPGSTSFWTSLNTNAAPDISSENGFWSDSRALKIQSAKNGFDSPDGQIVERGGAGQQLRLKYLMDTYTGTKPTTSRNLLTCIDSTGATCAAGTSLNSKAMAFSAGNLNLTTTTLGIPTAWTSTTLGNFIKWVRGEDTAAIEADSAAGAEYSTPPFNTPAISIRGSVHGDVLHSRPAVINYGGTTGVVVFYGSNDGVYRAVNGNQPPSGNSSPQPMGNCTASSTCAIPMTDANQSATTVPPGGELWGFVPKEFYSGLQRLYLNSPVLNIGGVTTGAPKNYFFDGPTGIYQNTKTQTAYIYLSARRGGRLIYALDVSDPTNPKFMWKRTNADPGFGELGQTWSQPKVAFVRGYTDTSGVAKPVLIFGAGYDPNEDNESSSAADSMGRGIFVVDAVTGQLVWEAVPVCGSMPSGATCLAVTGMNYAMPADVTLVDRDYDGYIDRLYASDVGGNIWRVDLQPQTSSSAPSTWQVTQLASLGGTGSTGTTRRKFFFPPDVVLTKQYDVVIGSTGDREHPLVTQKANTVLNRFYMIKDTNVGMSSSGWTTVVDASDNTMDVPPSPLTLFNATSTPYDGSLSGFYVSLLGLTGNVTSKGEQGINAPTTAGGYVYFGTNQPIPPGTNTCQVNLGKARAYAVNFLTGAAFTNVLDGGGLAPSPVFGVVDVSVNGTRRQLPFLIGGGVNPGASGSGGGGGGVDCRSALGNCPPPPPTKTVKKRLFWHRDIDR